MRDLLSQIVHLHRYVYYVFKCNVATCLEGHRIADADLGRLGNVPRGHDDRPRSSHVHRHRVGRARVVEHRDRQAGVERSSDSRCLRPLRVVPLFKLWISLHH